MKQLKIEKKTQEKERESCRLGQMGPWGMLLMHLPQIALVERSYVDLGFLRTKNKGFLRKDVNILTYHTTNKFIYKFCVFPLI